MIEAANEEISNIQAGEASANASSKNIVRNVAMSYVSTAASMATAVFATPVLIRTLGPEQFGLWTLLLSMVAYLGLFDLGIGTAVAKRVADCHATGDQARLACVLGTALAIYLVLASGLMAAAFVAAPWLGHFSKTLRELPPAVLTGGKIALVLLSANQALVFIYNVQASVLYGAGRLDLLTPASVISNVGVAVLNVVLVLRGAGVMTLAIIMAANTVCLGITTNVIIARCFPASRLRVSLATWPMVRELMTSGARNAGLQLSAAISYGADTLIIGLFLPLSSVAIYTVGGKLVNVVKNIATKPVAMLLPAYAHCDALGDRERQFRLFTRGVNFSLGLAMPVTLVLFIFGDRLIEVWAGPHYSASYPVLLLLAFALLIQLQSFAACILSQATERNARILKFTSASAVANLLLSCLFTWRFGVIGPALGSVCCVLIVDGILIPRHICWQMGRRPSEYVRASLRPLVLPTLLATTVLLGARLSLEASLVARVDVAVRHAMLQVAPFSLPPGLLWLLVAAAVSGFVFLGAWNPAFFTGEGSFAKRLQSFGRVA